MAVAETAIGASFRKSGVVQLNVEFRVAASRFYNLGMSFNDMRAELDDLERMSGMGQSAIASRGRTWNAQTRQPIEGGEATSPLPQGHRSTASPPSSNRGGEGQATGAPQRLRVSALPVREPTVQQRMISARNALVVAITIMDTLKIDGRAIGDWTVAEARRAGHLKTREGHILITASRMVANAAGNELLRSVVKPYEMQKIVQKAAEVADAV